MVGWKHHGSSGQRKVLSRGEPAPFELAEPITMVKMLTALS